LRRAVAALLLVLGASRCADSLTPSRAATILRHSKAFLSGAPESQPVLDSVTAVAPEGDDADHRVVEFRYHFPGADAMPIPAKAVLRRSGGSWAVDDELSRQVTPSWPRLPRQPAPFGSAAGSAR
jgi:hypothetical protein